MCNANSLVRSYKDKELQKILNNFDIATPDGFPVAKASNILYKNDQKRVDGYKIFNHTLGPPITFLEILKKLLGK